MTSVLQLSVLRICQQLVQTARWGRLGELRKAVLSASLICIRFNQLWRSSTTRLAIDLLINWAVIFVARKARSVVLHMSLKAAGTGLDSFMAQTLRTSIVWSTEPACPDVE